MGGSWLGVLAVDDESAANILASSDGASEITAQKYDDLKKKRQTPEKADDSRLLLPPRPPAQSLFQSAAPAVQLGKDFGNEAALPVTPPEEGITLRITNLQPPDEAILMEISPKNRRVA